MIDLWDGRHFGGIWEASGRHLGGMREASGRLSGGWGGHGRPEVGLEGKCAKTIVFFLLKVARATISRRRERPDPHQVRSLRTKVGKRVGRATLRQVHGYLYQAARTPTEELCLGNIYIYIYIYIQYISLSTWPQGGFPCSFAHPKRKYF